MQVYSIAAVKGIKAGHKAQPRQENFKKTRRSSASTNLFGRQRISFAEVLDEAEQTPDSTDACVSIRADGTHVIHGKGGRVARSSVPVPGKRRAFSRPALESRMRELVLTVTLIGLLQAGGVAALVLL
jgi:hypothetical protein